MLHCAGLLKLEKVVKCEAVIASQICLSLSESCVIVISATLHVELAQIVGHFEYYSAPTKSKSVTGGYNIQCKQGRS